MDIVTKTTGCLIMSFIQFYMCSKILNTKIDYKSKKFILIFLLFSLYLDVIYATTDNFIRVIITYAIFSFALNKLFDVSIVKSIVTSFIIIFYTFISEIFFAIIITVVFKLNISDIQNQYFSDLLSNFAIAVIMFLIIKIKKLTDFCTKIISNIDEKSNKKIFLFIISTVVIFSLVLYSIYFSIDLVWFLIIGIIVLVIFATLLLNFIKEKIDNYKLKNEYDLVLDNLSEYEKMYALQRMKNHEYKNDLSVLRAMIDPKNKKALDYINNIIDLKKDVSNAWMETLKIIPEGGLRGIIYYKLLDMQQKQIKFEFSPGKNYNPTSYIKLKENVKNDVCKLLGIYLDNAIQAVEKISKKKIYLGISETENSIIFTIGNNFNNNVDLSRIYEKGYTTKEKGNGYGLAIAQEIVDSNNFIRIKTKIIRDKFIQELKIKKGN